MPESFDKGETAITENEEANISDPDGSGSSVNKQKGESHKSSCESEFACLFSYFQVKGALEASCLEDMHSLLLCLVW